MWPTLFFLYCLTFVSVPVLFAAWYLGLLQEREAQTPKENNMNKVNNCMASCPVGPQTNEQQLPDGEVVPGRASSSSLGMVSTPSASTRKRKENGWKEKKNNEEV